MYFDIQGLGRNTSIHKRGHMNRQLKRLVGHPNTEKHSHRPREPSFQKMDPTYVDQKLVIFQKLVGVIVEGMCLYVQSTRRLNSRANLVQDMCSEVHHRKQVSLPTGEDCKSSCIVAIQLVDTYRPNIPIHRSPEVPEYLTICTSEFILSGCGGPGQDKATASKCQGFAQRRMKVGINLP